MKFLLAGSGWLALLGSLLGSLFSISHYPNDPAGTLIRAHRGIIRVGYTRAEPWVRESAAGPQGIEPMLVAGFARQLPARIEWVPGSEEQLFKALKHHEIDLLIGGFTADSPWQDDVALTRPYLEAALYVGYRPTAANALRPDDLRGRTVAVRPGTDQGYYVRQHEGRPLPTNSLPGALAFAVGYEWQLRRWGLRTTGLKLTTENHVLAVPPGENAWLVALETYLDQHQPADLAGQ